MVYSCEGTRNFRCIDLYLFVNIFKSFQNIGIFKHFGFERTTQVKYRLLVYLRKTFVLSFNELVKQNPFTLSRKNNTARGYRKYRYNLVAPITRIMTSRPGHVCFLIVNFFFLIIMGLRASVVNTIRNIRLSPVHVKRNALILTLKTDFNPTLKYLQLHDFVNRFFSLTRTYTNYWFPVATTFVTTLNFKPSVHPTSFWISVSEFI